jgi:hypothetical protein
MKSMKRILFLAVALLLQASVVTAKWLCCKDYFEMRGGAAVSPLCSDLEQSGDKLRLSYRISASQPFYLTLPHHVHSFHSAQRLLRGIEGAKALHRPPPPSDESMVLFDHVVQVFHAA